MICEYYPVGVYPVEASSVNSRVIPIYHAGWSLMLHDFLWEVIGSDSLACITSLLSLSLSLSIYYLSMRVLRFIRWYLPVTSWTWNSGDNVGAESRFGFLTPDSIRRLMVLASAFFRSLGPVVETELGKVCSWFAIVSARTWQKYDSRSLSKENPYMWNDIRSVEFRQDLDKHWSTLAVRP